MVFRVITTEKRFLPDHTAFFDASFPTHRQCCLEAAERYHPFETRGCSATIQFMGASRRRYRDGRAPRGGLKDYKGRRDLWNHERGGCALTL